MIAFVPDNEKYTRPAPRMDEEFVRGLRTFCERQSADLSGRFPRPDSEAEAANEIVCARQARLHLPGTVFRKIFQTAGGLRLSLQFKVYQTPLPKG